MKNFIITALFASALALGAKNPNIVYILADDLGIGELSCYGQEKMKTPNIDRMATEGMQFSRHYSGSTVCAPSRCTLMTGLHTGHCSIRGNAKSPIKGSVGNMHMAEGTYTIAQMLKDKGYKTGIFGKWGLGSQESPTSPLKAGFDRFFGYNDQSHAHKYFTEYLWDDDKKVTYKGNNNTTKKDYSADTIHAEAIKFIDENKDNPFFIYYATTLPHADVISIEKYQAQFRGKFLPEVSFDGKKGGYVAQPETHAAFAAMVHTLDTHVGEIFKKLEDEGILDNTLIIFSSDNGTHLEGGHNPTYWESTGGLRGHKREVYEGGIRTPMLVYWKNKVAPTSKTSHISAFWDVLPTFAEIVDAEIPEGLDGISFLPTLLGKDDQKTHDYLYWEFKEGNKKALLQGDWKLVVLNVSKSPTYELYNLAEDRAEKNDISSKHPEKVEAMKAILKEARTAPDIKAFEFGAISEKDSKDSKNSKKSKK